MMLRFFRILECSQASIPIALDQACVDACLAAEPIRNSQLGDNLAKPEWHCHHNHFMDSNPNVEWEATLDHGAEDWTWNKKL